MSLILDALKREGQAPAAAPSYAELDSHSGYGGLYAVVERPRWPWVVSAAMLLVALAAWALSQGAALSLLVNAADTPQQSAPAPDVMIGAPKAMVVHVPAATSTWPPRSAKVMAEPEPVLPAQPVAATPVNEAPDRNAAEVKVAGDDTVETPIDAERPKRKTISPSLLATFEAAVKATEPTGAHMPLQYQPEAVDPLGTKPQALQDSIPPLNFSQHNYSSDQAKRWVKVNGHEAVEGDEIAPGLTLLRIEPQQVVMEKSGQQFSLPALSEW